MPEIPLEFTERQQLLEVLQTGLQVRLKQRQKKGSTISKKDEFSDQRKGLYFDYHAYGVSSERGLRLRAAGRQGQALPAGKQGLGTSLYGIPLLILSFSGTNEGMQ